MPEIIQGDWADLIGRQDLHGRKVRVIVLDDKESTGDPWVKRVRA